MNPMPGEEYKGIVDYMFTGDDGNTVDGEISYTAEVVGSDGDIDNNGAGGFYGLKVIPDSLEAHFDELGSENYLAKIDDDFANEQILPGGDEHDEALAMAQEDADEMFAEADIDIPMESNELTEAPMPDFQYLSTMPVADNFLRFVQATNKDREERQRQSGGYSLPSMQQITDEQQLQRVWEHFLNEFGTYVKQDVQDKYWQKIKDNAKQLVNDNTFGGIPPEYKITDEEQFIVNFLNNRKFAHTKQMMKRLEDFINSNKQEGSIESLQLFDESVDMSMNEELNRVKKLAGLEEACGGCEEQEQGDSESVHFRKEKSSDTGSVSIEASADSMEEMKRLLALIGHDLPKEMSPHSDGEVDNGPDGEEMAEPVAITVTQPEQGEKPFDPYGNNKKALLNYLRDSYKSQ